MKIIFLLILIVLTLPVSSQSNLLTDSASVMTKKIFIINNPSDYYLLPKSCILTDIKRSGCKQIEYVFKDTASTVAVTKGISEHLPIAQQTPTKKKKNFISVHGNVTYDYFYQSHLDTPYFANDIEQQTISTYLDIRIKDEYPLRVYFTTRFGNTDYLRNITNLNFQYSPQAFVNTMRDRIKSYAHLPIDTSILRQYSALLNQKINTLNSIKTWLHDPSVLQKLVEAKEAAYVHAHRKNVLPSMDDSIIPKKDDAYIPNDKSGAWSWLDQKLNNNAQKNDSIKPVDSISIVQKYNTERQRADSLDKQITELMHGYQSKRDSLYALKLKWNSGINRIKNPTAIRDEIEQNNVPDSTLPRGYKTLLAVQKFGIGTSVVNYSELSAKDVTITGLQFEYTPKFYYALAAGVINNRFRNYLLPEPAGPKQYLSLVRFGKQSKDSSSLIFTYYFGRKMLYNYYTTDSLYQLTAPHPDFNLMGFTLEKRVRLYNNTFLTAEVAKSSLPYYHITTNEKQFSSVLAFSDRSNEAYSLKINSFIPSTQTKIEAYYKHYGANFQSFTLISTSSAQNAFLLNANQSFFRRQLTLNASIRKNDFIDPLLDQRFVSNTIFKSLQATMTVRYLPVISVGFYPVTQLVKLNDVTFSENLFYTLTANASYMYNTHHTAMSTTIVWMRFYNNPVDSGFVYFNANNLLINHSIFFRQATLQTSLSTAANTKYSLWSWGENLQVRLNTWLSLGGGYKYNKQDLLEKPQIGYAVNSSIRINHLGSFQLRMEKAYISGLNQQLVPNSTGRLTYYRSF